MPKHKAQQLAAQVRRALDHALMTLCDDEILENVSVDTVTPTPDESRMTVVFVAHGDAMTLGREARHRPARSCPAGIHAPHHRSDLAQAPHRNW